MTTLADIDVGDFVTLMRRECPVQILRVERVTKVTIITKSGTYRRTDGHSRGSRGWDSSRIVVMTQDHRAQLRHDELVYRVLHVEEKNWEKLTDEQLAQVLAWAKKEG